MALSGASLEEVIKSELRGEWESEKKIWFPSSENYAHDLREPGELFWVLFVLSSPYYQQITATSCTPI